MKSLLIESNVSTERSWDIMKSGISKEENYIQNFTTQATDLNVMPLEFERI